MTAQEKVADLAFRMGYAQARAELGHMTRVIPLPAGAPLVDLTKPLDPLHSNYRHIIEKALGQKGC